MVKTINGLKINYEEKGQGDLIVLLHGWGSNITLFANLIDLLSKKYKVVAMDMPGFGKSDEPKEPWDVSAYVQFVIDFLKDYDTKEVMLLGQNVDSYRDASGNSFADLIKAVNDIEGIERIRFMTSHPKDISDEMIGCFRTCAKLCRNIHLPVQSGSDRILKRMNRHYDRKTYLDIVGKLRAAAPDITISTDIIVGFPGETEEDFEDTLDIVRKVGYDSAFTFIYSPREGTPAAKFEDQIPDDVCHERFDRLVDVLNAISLKKNSEYKGRICEVIAEGVSRSDDTTISGRTDGFKLVNFTTDRSPEEIMGKTVKVLITESKTFRLEGAEVR